MQVMMMHLSPAAGRRRLRRAFGGISLAWLCSVVVPAALAVSGPPAALAMSEKKEIELGAKEHQKVIAQFGIYKDAELAAYVDRIGQKIAKVSSRPNLEYTFTVIDDDMVNAMALPGGYIYLSRGLLAHMNTESELAAVIGHEIAHVTEKHAIRNQNRAQGYQAAAMLAAILTQQGALMELGELGSAVLLKGHGREFELEADRVGAGFMAKAGYAPDAMLKTIETLKSNDKLEYAHARIEQREAQVYHGFLSTHPDHDRRYEKAILAAGELGENYGELVPPDEFLEKLNGLGWGDRKQVGVVRRNVFYHPKLGIKVNFPQGWRIGSTQKGIMGLSTVGNAAMEVRGGRLYKGATPTSYVAEKLGMQIREGQELTIDGLPAFLGVANRYESTFGPRPTRVAVIFDSRRRQAYIMTGAGKHDLRKVADDKTFIRTIFSFARMTKDDFTTAKTPKVQIVRAEEGTTFAALAAESPITNYAEDRLRVINGLYPQGEPSPGQLIKIIQ